MRGVGRSDNEGWGGGVTNLHRCVFQETKKVESS